MVGQPGAYGAGMRCPRCGSNWLGKYGRPQGMQRFRCQQCPLPFHSRGEAPAPAGIGEDAEGNSIKVIGWVLEVKAGNVYSWVKKACQARSLLPIVGEQRRDRSWGR